MSCSGALRLLAISTGHLGPLLGTREFGQLLNSREGTREVPWTNFGFARYTVVYMFANVWKPPSSLWDRNDLSATSSLAGSGGGGPRLIAPLGIESTGKYFESVPTGVGVSFLRFGLGTFGISWGPSWVNDGEVHGGAIVDSHRGPCRYCPPITSFSNSSKGGHDCIYKERTGPQSGQRC